MAWRLTRGNCSKNRTGLCMPLAMLPGLHTLHHDRDTNTMAERKKSGPKAGSDHTPHPDIELTDHDVLPSATVEDRRRNRQLNPPCRERERAI